MDRNAINNRFLENMQFLGFVAFYSYQLKIITQGNQGSVDELSTAFGMASGETRGDKGKGCILGVSVRLLP